jgi:hypothetical protein
MHTYIIYKSGHNPPPITYLQPSEPAFFTRPIVFFFESEVTRWEAISLECFETGGIVMNVEY